MAKSASHHTETHIPWDDLRIFLAVAEAGSLSGASARLQVTQPTVSRRIAALEARLGEPLFVRAIDGVTPTAYGERLLEPTRRMDEWSAEASRAAEQRETTPTGVVRITAPPGVAWEFVAPFAALLREALPAIRLEVLASVQTLDLARREADLALRLSDETTRELTRLMAIEFDVAPFAAESYARRLPKKYGFADVDWIGWTPALGDRAPNRQLAAIVPGFAPAFASDDYLVQVRAAELGAGALFRARLRHRFSPESRWVELDLDVGELRGSLQLLSTKSALAIPRVRAVADALVRELEQVVAPRRRRRGR